MSGAHGSPKRHKGHDDEEDHGGGHERWLVTYADMLTLLMVLFIVLFASSNIDKKKYAGLQKSLSKAFNDGSPATSGGTGVLDGGTTPNKQNGKQAGNPVGPGNAQQKISPDPGLEKLAQSVSQAVASKNLSKSVSESVDANGLTITIVTDHVLFNSGSADLLPEGVKIIDALAPSLRDTGGRGITVNGYTDNQKISGPIKSNLTLSLLRANTVSDELMGKGVFESTLKAEGFGAQDAIADNNTEEGRGKNRRVVIVVANADGSTTSTNVSTGATTTSTAVIAGKTPTTAASSAAASSSTSTGGKK